jgi:hypothetical protein
MFSRALLGPYLDLTHGNGCDRRGTVPHGRSVVYESSERCRPPGDLLEVLAGAISWGFKSPSPHHIKSRCRSLTSGFYPFPVISSSFPGQSGFR